MPRKARIDAPGSLHHVIVREIERRRIFRSDYDRKNFLNRISELIPATHKIIDVLIRPMLIHNNLLFANAFPEWDFKYFSKE
jgi:hypothetical protein